MRKTSLILAVVVLGIAGRAVSADDAPSIYESSTPVTAAGELDKIVLAKLKSLDIEPVLCSDAVFVRRAYLDMIGTLPTAEEAKAFIDDTSKNKRVALIDRLFERDEFADYWSMRWGDVLRIKAEFPVNLWPNAAQAYHRWVRASIAENKPYDQFAREMLTSSGSNFRVGPVNFYRAIQNKTPEGIATAAALVFMGTRTDPWPKERLAGMTAFFSQVGYKPTSEWKEENVFWDPLKSAKLATSVAPGRAKLGTAPRVVEPEPKDESEDSEKEDTEKEDTEKEDPDKDDTETEEKEEPEATEPPVVAGPIKAVFPDGTEIELPPNKDPREVFADWLITPENPWFTRAITNRVWAWLMGRGIVHEPDDIRDDNPPVNPELMAYLEKELIDHDYDLKHLYRLILTSNAYQFSSIPRSDKPEAAANFAAYPLRRLDAEVLIDAINDITGTTDLYTSPIPEPFTYIPKDQPAIALADGSITSPFLALFGRSARATGMANERNNRPVPAQWLHMLNSSHIQTKLERSVKLKAIFTSGRPAAEVAEEFYLTILSRRPTPEEMEVVAEYATTIKSRTYAAVDLVWALINSPEFLYRH